jgi:hypothetical protein
MSENIAGSAEGGGGNEEDKHSEGIDGQGLLPAAILPGEATPLEGAASSVSGSRSPARALAGSLLGAFRGTGRANESGVAPAGTTPARSPVRRLAGTLLSPFARRRTGEEVGGTARRDEVDGIASGEESDARQRLRSPLHGIASTFKAALRSFSPPRTANSTADRVDETEGKAKRPLSQGLHRFGGQGASQSW